MFLGNIVSENPLNMSGLYNVTDNLENIVSGIPTLIIGWGFTKLILSDRKPSILEKKIDDNLFWTFTKRERRFDYEQDIKKYISTCLNHIENTIKYKYINILTSKIGEIKKILKLLTKKEISHIYIRNDFCYLLNNDTIYGIDLNTIDFINIERKKIYKLFYTNNCNVHFNDEIIPKDVKLNITNKNIKITPYIIKLIEQNEQH